MPNDSRIPAVADLAPDASDLTIYDKQHLTIYLRLLDAELANANWEEAAQIVLKFDPKANRERAHKAWESHLARAHWLTNNGYRLLLERAPR